MARQVQADQSLEQKRPARPGRAQKHQQARGRATIGDHVQHGTEASRLLKIPSSYTVQSIQQARDAVQDRARSWMEGHVVQRCNGQDDA